MEGDDADMEDTPSLSQQGEQHDGGPDSPSASQGGLAREEDGSPPADSDPEGDMHRIAAAVQDLARR